MEWSNDLVIEFLDLYEREPSIWDPKNPLHRDRNAVYDAWKRIQSALSVDMPMKELKKKKDCLMATYRKLYGKYVKSKGAGSTTDDVYRPEWFAFEKMESFLRVIYIPRETQLTEGHELECINTPTQKNTLLENGNAVTPDEPELKHENEDVDDSDVLEEEGPPAGKRRKPLKVAVVDKRREHAYNFLKTVSNKAYTPKGECELFCDLLCVRLKALDEETRETAMHEIENLVFRLKVASRRQGSGARYFPHNNCLPLSVETHYSPQGPSSSSESLH